MSVDTFLLIRLVRSGWVLVLLLALGGCSMTSQVQPWEKAHLAQPEMQMEPDVSASRWMEHIYFSREAVSGANGLGGRRLRMQLKDEPVADPPVLISQGWLAGVAAAVAMALPQAADAQGLQAPTQAEISWRWMDYREHQDDQDRMRVMARSAHLRSPLGEQWSVDAYAVVDAISGASPYYYATPSAFVEVKDKRRAADVRLSHHQSRERWTFGASRSNEADYDSEALMLQWSVADELQNLVFDIGVSATRDRINPVNKKVFGQRKRVDEALVGLTWVVSPVDLVQMQMTRSLGRGYYSDPYKFLDERPGGRRVTGYQIKWNHHQADKATWRTGLRHLRDDWGVRTWGMQLERASRMGAWRLTPGVRYHVQSAAYFFQPPDPLVPDVPNFPANFVWGRSLSSFDQRLSGFGAVTGSLKVDYLVSAKAEIHLRVDHYRQRSVWAGPFQGTAAIPDFSANTVQLGWTYRFGN